MYGHHPLLLCQLRGQLSHRPGYACPPGPRSDETEDDDVEKVRHRCYLSLGWNVSVDDQIYALPVMPKLAVCFFCFLSLILFRAFLASLIRTITIGIMWQEGNKNFTSMMIQPVRIRTMSSRILTSNDRAICNTGCYHRDRNLCRHNRRLSAGHDAGLPQITQHVDLEKQRHG